MWGLETLKVVYTKQYPKVHIVFHKAIRIYMGGLILGVNTLYRVFCFLKLFIIGGKKSLINSHKQSIRPCYNIHTNVGAEQ